MERENLDLSLAALSASLMGRQVLDSILACNEELGKHGLALTQQQALALAQTRSKALRECKRVEFSGGIVDKLILAFCDSPYLNKDSFEGTLHELIGLFYDLKKDTWERVSDDELIAFLKKAFDQRCHGSLELLADEALRLSAHLRQGKTLRSFEED